MDELEGEKGQARLQDAMRGLLDYEARALREVNDRGVDGLAESLDRHPAGPVVLG